MLTMAAELKLTVSLDGKIAVREAENIAGSVKGIGAAAATAGQQGEAGLGRVGSAAQQGGRQAQRAADHVRSIGASGRQAGAEGASGVAKVGTAAEQTGRQAQRAADFIRNMVTAILSVQGAKALIVIADQAATLHARLKLASQGEREFALAREETFAISQRTNTALESTVNLYARLRQSTSDYGIEQSRLLALTETINQTFTVSGTGAVAQANAITQLTQAFAGGVLRAEEFNSVIENSPRLAQAFADGLGVTMGGLRKMVNDGEVDIGRMIAALEGQASTISEEYAQIPLTVERAWTQLNNAVLRYVGDADQAAGVSRQLADAVAYLASNIDKIAPVVGAAVAAFAGWLALATPLGRIVSAVAAVTAVIADLLDTTDLADEVTQAYAESLRVATEANAANSAASLSTMAALREEAAARLEVAKAALAEANAKAIIGDWLFWTPDDLAAAREAEANVDLLTQRIAELDAKAGEAIVGGLQDFFTGLVEGSSAADSASAPLSAFRKQVEEAKAALDKARQSTAEYRAERQALILTEAAARGMGSDQLGALRAELESGEQLIRQSGELTTARSRATAAKRESERADREQKRAAEELLKADRELQTQLADLTADLAGPAAIAQREYERIVDATRLKLQEMTEAAAKAGQGTSALAEAEAAAAQIQEAAAEARDRKIKELERERDILGQLTAEHNEEMKALGMTRRELAGHQAAVRAAERAQAAWGAQLAKMPGYLERVKKAASEGAKEAFDLQEQLTQVEDILAEFGGDAFDSLVSKVETLREEIERLSDPMSDAFDPARVAELERAVGRVRVAIAQDMLGATAAAIRGIQSMADEGSSSYRNMQIAIEALTAAQAILGIVNQSSGDPYTAFARMAAMAAIMAQFVSNVSGSFGGGFSDTAAERQASQGTGTVLGDSDAKSESILRATEITADATTELVGINRGMLRALIQLQDGIAGAGRLLARGAGDADFSSMAVVTHNAINQFSARLTHVLDPIFGRAVSGIMNRLVGARSSVTDQGLSIAGGSISDLLNNMNVRAYGEISSRSWFGGSTRTNTQYSNIDDGVARQFQLVMESIVGTVREAATALGMLPAEIDAALATYEQEEIRISLMDLDAEEQQAELEAVFSSIFDGLAGHVVPFIDQFQRVGEGLGETLVRVATSVQVVQESMRYLGLAIDETDPERFAQLSVALIDAAGGIDEFIAGMMAFSNAFAPESFRFAAAESALTDAFSEAGLAIPATRDAMWELMQSLDATTDEGRAQIAMLLRLTDAADAYYDGLERQEEATQRAAERAAEHAALLSSMGVAGRGLSEFGQAIAQIRAQEAQAIEAANELAQARGREGASAYQLAAIHHWAASQIASAMRRLQAETRDLIAQLFGGVPGSLDAINARIAELEGATVDLGTGINGVAEAGSNMFERWRSAIDSLAQYLDNALIGDLSPLSPEEQIDEAQRQLDAAIAAARTGDADAIEALPRLMDQYARLWRGHEASGQDFNAPIRAYHEQLREILNQPGPSAGGGAAGPGAASPIQVAVSASPELQALYDARDAALAQQEAEHRATLALQLMQNLAEMAHLTRTPILDMIALQQTSLAELVDAMGINLEELTAGSVLALGSMATTLGISLETLAGELGIELTELGGGISELLTSMGISLDEITGGTVEQLAGIAGTLGLSLTGMTEALGLELTDLAGGMTELTTRLGINLGNLTVESTGALGDLARDLGIDLTELTRIVGVEIGDLTDSQSLLHQTFANELASMPQRERDLLQPLLAAVADAATEADANAAIRQLESAVGGLSPAIRNQLAPYLTGIFPAGALDELDHLANIDSLTSQMLSALRDIARGLDVPGYAVGTSYVPHDMLARIHQGEMVIDPATSHALRTYGIRVSAGGEGGGVASAEVLAELRRLRAAVAELSASNDSGHRATAKAVNDGDTAARAQRADIARRAEVTDRSRAYGR